MFTTSYKMLRSQFLRNSCQKVSLFARSKFYPDLPLNAEIQTQKGIT
jgi:hypothetical protein